MAMSLDNVDKKLIRKKTHISNNQPLFKSRTFQLRSEKRLRINFYCQKLSLEKYLFFTLCADNNSKHLNNSP